MVQRITLAVLSALIYLSSLISQSALAGWKVPFDGSKSEPIIHNGIIYVGSFDGTVVAFDAKSGKQIWLYQTGSGLTSGPQIILDSGNKTEDQLGAALNFIGKKGKGKREIDATPVIKHGTLYVGSKDYQFYALDAKTGNLRWATDIDHMVFRKAIVTEQHVIIHGIKMGRKNNALFVLDRENGKIKWSTQGIGSAAPPAFYKNTVFYASEPKHVYLPSEVDRIYTLHSADVDSGKILWSIQFKGQRPSRPVISTDTIFVTAFEGGGLVHNANNTVSTAPMATRLYAINTSTGKLVWVFKGGSDNSPKLTVGPKHIFYFGKEGLYAIDIKTGKQGWFLEGAFSQFETVLGEFLYVHGDSTRNDKRFYAIDASMGEVIWSYRDNNLFYTKVVENTVYISAEQSLVALNATTGKKLWEYKTGGIFKAGSNVSASPLIFENHVIFPTRTKMVWGEDDIQGHLYSIDTRTGKIN